MCNMACLKFGYDNLSESELRGKRIVDIGAQDVNGSLREHCMKFDPECYLGVDISKGNKVDVICDVCNLSSRFGCHAFDVVISTEMLEHIENWILAIENMKQVCRPNGIILITTRSIGFPKHDWPNDWWRYQLEDMEQIFSDFNITNLERDPGGGVLVKAVKPVEYKHRELYTHKLYNINSRVPELCKW